MAPKRRPNWHLGVIAVVWLLVALRLGSAFSGYGAEYWHVDLATLYREQSTFYAGVYPHEAVTPTPGSGPGVRSDYPPFSFPLFVAWLPPLVSFTAARIWFSLWQAVALASVVVFAAGCGRGGGRALPWLLGGGVLAMTGVRADLLFGNVSLIATGCLLGFYGALSRKPRWWLGGVWVLCMIKPQKGWTFALMLVARRAWGAILMAALTLATLVIATCAWTGVTPWGIVNSRYSESLDTISRITERNSLVTLLAAAGVPSGVALAGCALAGVAVGGWLLHGRLRDATQLRQFAVLGLISRVFTYHNYCDDLLLVFALVELGRRAWIGRAAGAWTIFLLLGATVWAPTAALQHVMVRVAAMAVWLVALAWLAREETEKTKAGDSVIAEKRNAA